jgi:hypothetical protein
VLISEFEHRTSNDRYLFVVNGRTHPTEGHRHITVKLAPASDPLDQCLVENVLTGDIWLVRPTGNPDTTTVANGFTDYFAPGAAALYRIFPWTPESPDVLTDCFPHTFTVTRGAVMSLANTPVLLAHGGRIVVEDSTMLTDCQVECCAIEGKASIDVRNGGSLHLLGSSLSYANSRVSKVPIAVGPDSRLNSVYTIHNGLSGDAAITIIDGYARTFGNAIDLSGRGVFVRMWGNSELLARFDSVQGNTAVWSYGIEAYGGRCYLQNVRLLNVDIALYATNNAFIQGCDSASPKKGYNKIRANDVAMFCYDSEIFLGEAPNNWYATHNSIGILDPSLSNHVMAPTGVIYAQYNFWGYGSGTPMQSCPPLIAGPNNIFVDPTLPDDPVPFTSSEGEQTLSKTVATTALNPGNIRATVLGYLAANAQTDARDAIGNFLQAGGGLQVGTLDLGFLYRTVKQVNGQALVADILSDCLTRTDLRSKLLAADILQHEGDPATALSVLNSYSFVASDTLMRDALLRKAVLYPLTGPGGYADGLAAIDTLAGLVAFDSTLQGFIDLYPRLLGGLSVKTQATTPKKQTFGYAEMLQPTAIELWPNYPNPFRDLTSFTFKLHEAMHVRLVVHDAMGREVAVVTDAQYARGVHSVVLRGDHLPSGMYFCRLMTDGEVIQRNMMLLR